MELRKKLVRSYLLSVGISPIHSSLLFAHKAFLFFPYQPPNRAAAMAAFQQLRTHVGKLFVFVGVLAFLSFYYFHGLPSSMLASVPDRDVHSPTLAFLGPTSGQKHPIEILVEEARRKHTHILESQSKSLEQAIANYKKRYHREPPPGFDDWYHTAVSMDATIIDEYDTVMAMFEPFWGISARELRARVREALDPRHLNGAMVGIQVRDHQFFTVNEKTAGSGTGRMLHWRDGFWDNNTD